EPARIEVDLLRLAERARDDAALGGGRDEVGDVARQPACERRRSDRDALAERGLDHLDRCGGQQQAAARAPRVLVTPGLGPPDRPRAAASRATAPVEPRPSPYCAHASGTSSSRPSATSESRKIARSTESAGSTRPKPSTARASSPRK